MVSFDQEMDYQVFDPDAYYAYTSVIHNELYLTGTVFLHDGVFQHQGLICYENQIRIPNKFFPADLNAAVKVFSAVSFARQVYEYSALARKAILRLDNALDKRQVGEFYTAFKGCRFALAQIMSTANFFKLYVDRQDEFNALLAQQLAGKLNEQQVATLTSQPAVTPFLKVLKFGALKYCCGRQGIYKLLNRVYFLRGFDLNVSWEKLQDIDLLLSQVGRGETKDQVCKRYTDEVRDEKARQCNVKQLRALAYQHTEYKEHLELALAAIDAEELRHYWQARALHVFSKLAEFLQLNPSTASLACYEKKLEAFQ